MLGGQVGRLEKKASAVPDPRVTCRLWFRQCSDTLLFIIKPKLSVCQLFVSAGSCVIRSETMTLQKRYFAEPADILTVRLCCCKCKAAVHIPLTSPEYMPDACPRCHANWFLRGNTDRQSSRESILSLIRTLTALKDRGEKPLFQVQLELNLPE